MRNSGDDGLTTSPGEHATRQYTLGMPPPACSGANRASGAAVHEKRLLRSEGERHEPLVGTRIQSLHEKSLHEKSQPTAKVSGRYNF